MTAFARLGCTTALAALISPHIALADINADDVLQNMTDYMAPLGARVNATQARSGDMLSLNDILFDFTLPMAAGTAQIKISNLTMKELGDGRVEITYPNPLTYEIEAIIADEGRFAGNLEITHEGMQVIASGTPSDISYDYAAQTLSIALSGLEMPEVEDAKAEMSFNISGLAGVSRVKTGNQVQLTDNSKAAAYDYDFAMSDEDGVRVTGKGNGTDLVSDVDATLLPGGMDLMNVAAAIRAGFRFNVGMRMGSSMSSQSASLGGAVLSEQSTKTGTQNVSYQLDENGLSLNGGAQDVDVSFFAPEDIPLPIAFAAQSVSAEMSLPLTKGDAPQEAAIAMNLEGTTISEDLWAMFDPGQIFPRDPATLKLDLTAQVKNMIDWLDFGQVAALDVTGAMPIEPQTMTLNGFTLEAAGAKLTGTGSAKFDNTDLETYDGLPKPSGTLDLSLIGGNGLIDKVVEAGLASPEDAMGARMMMSIVAIPDPAAGEDALKSRIELGEDGSISANGQRLR